MTNKNENMATNKNIHVHVKEVSEGFYNETRVTRLRWSLSDGRTGSDPIRPEGHPERSVSYVLGMIIVNAVKLFDADQPTPLCCSVEFHKAD